jgi:hypothetical protein
MDQRIFHGNLTPTDIARALTASLNTGNMHTQAFGDSDKMAVQIATRPGAMAGGQTALTVTIQKVEDGVLVQIGQQAWLGVAASLGATALTALSALRNPFSLLGRLDDLAQDIESLQLTERVWQIVGESARAMGASHELSERLARLVCEYCDSANPVGEANCVACGAPLGSAQPRTCPRCGYVVRRKERSCPNCNNPL